MDTAPLTTPPVNPYESPPPERRGGVLRWIVIGLAGLVMLQVCVLAVLVAFVPGIQARVLGLVGRASAPPPPEAPADATAPAPTGKVLIEDNFDQPTNRWDQSLNELVDGTYEMRIDIPNYDSYGLFLGGGSRAIDDFDMSVDVQQVAGDPTSEYGIRFRQTGPGDYLMFSISGSGYYRLVRVTNEQYHSLVPWTYDRRIKTGQHAVNRLRVIAQDANLTFFVNDAQLIQTQDEVDVGGQLTLGLTTFDKGGLVVRFDNIAGKAGTIDLTENFDDPEKVQWSRGGSVIKDGAYEITAAGGVQSWQQPLPTGSSKVKDFVLEVDATLVSEPSEDATYGVMFGDGGSFDFYSLLLFSQNNQGGVVLVQNFAGDRQAEVVAGQVPSAAVKPGTNQTNHIRIEVRDDTITVSINGEQLGSLPSPNPVRGMVGMIVSSGKSGAVRARFDNFRLEGTG